MNDLDFKCEVSCIVQGRYRCDYDKDCLDASDEKGCNVTDCTYFNRHHSNGVKLIKCKYTTACIMQSWVCDGHNDCWDNWDEIGCNQSK